MSREAMIRTIKGIENMRKVLRFMWDTRPTFSERHAEIDSLKDTAVNKLRALRKSLRPERSPKTFVEKAKIRISNDTDVRLSKYMDNKGRPRRWKHEMDGKAEPHAGYHLGRLVFHLNHGWAAKVYDRLIKNLKDGKHLLPLSATEYRINNRNVRLFSVRAWNFQTKKEVLGYIAQSKFTQGCVFKTDMHQAVRAAEALTVKDLDTKLGITRED